ncbi:hypothetical protein BT96DRAFT_921226 [Gymnopus androsaceus JB14]|uniref:Uncharacterized protein n=1 Tax=Gymnopus androsaceus JB14 TaxID=1447944 RepID=A0A6A4HIG9_9AGAR|nr:hypothetical protein BT96DRAFT_921226 [Gymnopus androsaceus JB14]
MLPAILATPLSPCTCSRSKHLEKRRELVTSTLLGVYVIFHCCLNCVFLITSSGPFTAFESSSRAGISGQAPRYSTRDGWLRVQSCIALRILYDLDFTEVHGLASRGQMTGLPEENFVIPGDCLGHRGNRWVSSSMDH